MHPTNPKKKGDVAAAVRTFGLGVPSLERAARSAEDAVTLVIEDRLVPYRSKKPGELKLGDMHYFDLPWPGDVLEELGETEVRMRIVLSYFVEPNPARRGWKTKYKYASHGLRFALKRALETEEAFRARINEEAKEEGVSHPKTDSDSKEWLLGQARDRGSLHADVWTGTAADLAARNRLAVHPIGGWWKDRPQDYPAEEGGVRYALVVSIEAEDVEVDLWTTVKQQVEVTTEVEIEVE